MSLALSHDAKKFLDNLQAKQFKQVASRVIDLERNPRPPDMKHMHGYPGYFRITVGEYRVIYKTSDEVVHVVAVGQRNDDAVYRSFDRLQ